jgi:hypothetical protein
MYHVLLALLLFAQADSRPGAAPNSQLLKIARSRAQITSGEVELRVHYETFKTLPKMAGNDCRVRCWFESDGKAFRLDSEDTKSQVDGLPAGIRYAYDGVSYKLMEKVNDAEYPLQEFTTAKPRTAVSLFDARVLGIYPSTFMALHHYTLNDVERIVTNAVTWGREETSGGFAETYNHKKGMMYKFSYSKDGLPSRYEFSDLQAASPYRYGGDIEYDSARSDLFSMPSKVSFRRYDANTLTVDEVWKVKVIQLNQPIDRSICSWEALSPKVGARLVVDRERQQKVSTVWNGSGFERVVTAPAGLQAEKAATQRSPQRRIVFVVINIIIVTILAYRWVRTRRDSEKHRAQVT